MSMAMDMNSVSANLVIRSFAVLIRSSGVCALIIALIASTSFCDLGVGPFCAIKNVMPDISASTPAKIDRFMKTPDLFFLFLKAALNTFLGGLFCLLRTTLHGQRLLVMLHRFVTLTRSVGEPA